MVSISLSYSMILMQQHNTDKYKKFLKILYNYNLYHICCCCKSMIIYELESDVESKIEQNPDNDNKNDKKYEDTLYETNDVLVKDVYSKDKPFELSIETTAQYARKKDDNLNDDKK